MLLTPVYTKLKIMKPRDMLTLTSNCQFVHDQIKGQLPVSLITMNFKRTRNQKAVKVK